MGIDVDVAEAALLHISWKGDETRDYAVAFVQAGLRLHDKGVYYFGSDDVPEAMVPASHTIAGTVASTLRAVHVIKRYQETHEDGKVVGGRRASKRTNRHHAWVNTYQFCSRQAAETFLKGYHVEVKPRQAEFALAQ